MADHTPGPWRVGHRAIDVGCENEKIGGYAKLFDVRGWGYLAGHGHGALGLDDPTAYLVQQANARLIAAAPDMLRALKAIDVPLQHPENARRIARDAIAKAEGRRHA